MKRMFVLVCVLAMVLSLGAVTAVQAASPAADFQVGFARVDINPYVKEDDFSSGIMALPLRGYGDVWNRLSTDGLLDDNGDGKIDSNDGLAVTCIAVTDEDGNTVLLMTADLIGGNLIEKARTEICTRLQALQAAGELQDVKLQPDQIFYAGTHTHAAPDITVYTSKGKTNTNDDGVSLKEVNENLGIWIDRTVVDIGDAAIAALRDRAAATVTKDHLAAKDATSTPVKGRVMNTVRHYWAEDKGCYAGDNFNSRGSNPKQVTQVNDNMYLLQFSFADSSKLPIILANWRAHPSMNSNNDYQKSSRNAISSDYPNAFRYSLEYSCTIGKSATSATSGVQKYRVAFFSGAGGNVNGTGQEKVNGAIVGKWIADLANARQQSRGIVYGRILAAMAQECMNTSANRESVSAGKVQTMQYVYNSVRKDTGYSALAYEAGKAYQAAAAVSSLSHPWKYTNAAGEVYVIGSRFHASNIISSAYWDTRLQQPTGDLVDMELNVFMLGQDLAFVTAPGEPFDYYYNADGSNAWDNLVDSTYGVPFVLGYCNGAKGYIPNSKAYDYNLGSTQWQRGSYETSISPYAQGTGEKMIQLFGTMLGKLQQGENTDHIKACTHCGKEVNWEAFSGKSELDTGHYYLLEDTFVPQVNPKEGATVCFDLNGHTIKGGSRCFHTLSNGNSTLNIMDLSPEGTGKVLGCGTALGAPAGFGGGAILVEEGNVLNIYSGQIGNYEKKYCSILRGGVIRNKGTVNMYGGTILGGKVAVPTGDYVTSGNVLKVASGTPSGAAVNNAGTFRMYGGEIQAGTVEKIIGVAALTSNDVYTYAETRVPTTVKGICVYSTGKFYICGDSVVADLCCEDTTGKLLVVDNRKALFTGSLHITLYKALSSSMKIGTCTIGSKLGSGTITVENGVSIRQSSTNLFADVKVLLENAGITTYYESLQDACRTYMGGTIQLLTNCSEDVTITKPTHLDLNGFNVTGNITVVDGIALYGKDTKTDDYTVADGKYGKLQSVTCIGTGAVEGHTEGDTYLKVTEAAGISFHKVDLQIATMSLRPSSMGLYYSAPFRGDELVAENVKSFGICHSVESAAAAKSMIPGTYSVCTEFVAGSAGNTAASTMVTNIMKTGNTNAVNAANAAMPIYGCAYVETEDGFLFGTPVSRSLQQQIESIDLIWKDLTEQQRDMLLALRFRYSTVVESWNVPNMLS